MSDQEIRREKVYVDQSLTAKQVQQKYGFKYYSIAWNALRRGYFVKNYSRQQVVIDRENFDPAYAYNLAYKVWWKNFSKYDGAKEIMPDMIQEAVKRLFELSGKVKEMANEKYNEKYQMHFIAHNAMLSFYKSYWQKANRLREKCRNALLNYPVFQQRQFLYDYIDEDGVELKASA